MAKVSGTEYTTGSGSISKSGKGLGRGTPHTSGTKHTNKGNPRPPHTDKGANGTHRAHRV